MIAGIARAIGSFAKWAALAFIFMRFHGSWLGLSVVVGVGILLFRLDRVAWRYATSLGTRS